MTDVDLSECPFDTEPVPTMGFEAYELDSLDHDPWGFRSDTRMSHRGPPRGG